MGGNRWDEIQGAARDVADWVCADPADRNRMADDLIRLVGLIIQGTGKGVAIDGESDMNECRTFGEESPGDSTVAYGRYLVGERIQTSAQTVMDESSNAGCDLDRYERDGLAPVWTSTRKQAHPSWLPVPPWRDRRHAEQAQVDEMNAAVRAAKAAPVDERAQHVDAIFQGGTQPTLTERATAAAAFFQPRDTQQVGCNWLPGDATTACDFDPDCPVHGDAIGRRNTGRCGDPDEQADGVPDHLYNEACEGTCCGGNVGPADLPEVPVPLHTFPDHINQDGQGVTKPEVTVDEQAKDRPLFAPGALAYYRRVLGLDKPDPAADMVGKVVPLCNPEPVDLSGFTVPTADAPHACQPVTALDGGDRPDLGIDGKPYTICGICGLLMNGLGPDGVFEGDGHGDPSHRA